MKALVLNGPSYFSPFAHLGMEKETNPSILWSSPEEVGLVIFTGGEDISPSLYGHNNFRSYTSPDRDKMEVSAFYKARKHNIPLAGICRGAQFLCAMAGGHIIQDVTGHGSNHYVMFQDGEEIKRSPEEITSTHHQMQYPWTMHQDDYEILAWSETPISSHYLYNGDKIDVVEAPDKFKLEPDVVFYKNINALAMQYHPEWMATTSWGFKFAQKMVSEKLGFSHAAV